MRKSNISFTEDIIKEVAEEFGVSEEEAMHVYINSVRYIKHHMNAEDTCAVNIPFLGTMHINKGLLFRSLRSQEQARDRGWSIDEERYEKNQGKMEQIKGLENRRRESGAKGSTSHTKKTILRKLKKKTGKNLDEIEGIQKKRNGEDK